MKGRPPKDISVLKKNGTYRPGRDGGRMQSSAASGKYLTPPDYFDKEHKKKWDSLIKTLTEHGEYKVLDYDSLELYVKAFVLNRKCYDAIMEQGVTIVKETKNGVFVAENPALKTYHETAKELGRIGDKFGFSPRARMGIKSAPAEKASDPIALLLSNKNKNAKAV